MRYLFDAVPGNLSKNLKWSLPGCVYEHVKR